MNNNFHEIFIKDKNCRVQFISQAPSPVSDYDYDPTDWSRRFISTYLHTLVFKDMITDLDIVTLLFSSDTCAQIILAFYDMAIRSEAQAMVKTIDNIFINSTYHPGSLTVIKHPGYIQLSIIQPQHPTIVFNLDFREAEAFMDMIDISELEDMYTFGPMSIPEYLYNYGDILEGDY